MSYLKRFFVVLVTLMLLLAVVYFAGPRVAKPDLNSKLPEITKDLVVLDRNIQQKEDAISNIKPDNHSQIVWFDSVPKKTEYAFLYLHGWSASHEEGAPLHEQLGKRYGANVYLPRLAGHGLQEKEAMLDLTATELFDSAKEALAVAKQLGEKVIVMGTSTGGTLALYIASQHPEIESLLLYSPNVAMKDESAKLLSGPWGIQLAKVVTGKDYHEFEADSIKQNYWTTKYRLEALTHLQVLMDEMMLPEVFAEVKQPTFMGYYYKNEEEQDNVVSVPALLEMYDQLGVDAKRKRKVAFPEVKDHVMTSHITSKDFESVKMETVRFLEEVLLLQPTE
ncbi:alpha/beta hydrolase [Maribacter sp. 2308TA10-17]|uniref:alpha/beta hydrolase n=1 Tax=Maribacter sp. 2308TA10-17 TaxID=3386276 RepID=UPI0039BCF753